MADNDRDPKIEQARALAAARESLERQIEQAVRTYQSDSHKPLDVEVHFTEEGEGGAGPELGDQHLRDTIRSYVSAFRSQRAVLDSGVRVLKVTAIDSDGDGKPAVDVVYDYKE